MFKEWDDRCREEEEVVIVVGIRDAGPAVETNAWQQELAKSMKHAIHAGAAVNDLIFPIKDFNKREELVGT